jgi:chaperonin GroES
MFRPADDKILIKPDVEHKTQHGIIIPNADKNAHDTGVVVAVGRGKYTARGFLVPPDVTPGERVVFSKYVPNEVKVDGEQHLIVLSEQILGVIEESD